MLLQLAGPKLAAVRTMQLRWFVFVVLGVQASDARHVYPNPHYHRYHVSSAQPPLQDIPVENSVVVDEKTGIEYNPYSKHHPG